MHYYKYSQMKNGQRWPWPPGRVLQGRLQRTFHPRDSWWWAQAGFWQCVEHCRCISNQCVQSSTSREVSGLLLGMERRTGSGTSSPGFLMLPSLLILVFLPLILLKIPNKIFLPPKGHRCQPEGQRRLHRFALWSQIWSPPCCSPPASGVTISISSLVGTCPLVVLESGHNSLVVSTTMSLKFRVWTRQGLRWMQSPMEELPHFIVQPTRYIVFSSDQLW